MSVTSNTSALADATFTNPFIYTDTPDNDVIRVGNVFYMTSTTMHMNPGVPIMKSYDLVNWEIVNYVYDTYANNDAQNLNNGQNEYGKGSWASSLRYYNGTYYVSFGSNSTGKTYIYQTRNIETGPWTSSVLGSYYHDASLLFDNGRVLLVYGSDDIRIIELTSDAKAVKSGGLNQVIIPKSSNIAGSSFIVKAEGAHIQKINGMYYVFLICWPSGSSRTQLTYRASSLTGPYTGRVALSDSGIAQGGIVDTASGSWYAMLFKDSGAIGRMPYLVPVTWSNNWPVFGVNGKAPLTMNVPVEGYPVKKVYASDEFSSSALAKVWQWNHNPDNTKWSLTQRPGFMRITTGKVSASILEARNTLTQRTFGPKSTGIIAMETSGMKDGDYSGLAAFQAKYGFVGVKMSGTSKSIVMVNASSGAMTEVASVPLSQNRVYFKVLCDFTNQTDKAYFYYSLDGEKWTDIGNTLQMSYTMPHFMGYRFALFNYATKSTGGFVDFDYLNLQ
ncbi:glycoside hydrolase 43 family protein [Paenibacillus polymyxa]|uniref:glycoside hydrolase family 43 protein n=1 Tax=Paenibacillus polymyxa TaxID=1406 RepID=UPI002AB4EA05|nr:glycoside hydrolase 43 family protein [Paenibacillus polymyxa]MDY8023409.1 glycoside hydrolase 43 family protein [Paenibacillus polymyxa]